MKRNWLGVLFGAWLCAGCGAGDDVVLPPAEGPHASSLAAPAAEGVNRPPIIHDLALHPATLESGGRVRAVVSASDPDGSLPDITFSWSVRGRRIDTSADSIQLPALHKGDRVRVTAVAGDGVEESEPVSVEATVPNKAPRLVELELGSREGEQGEEWFVDPWVEDPDQDHVTLEYTWLVDDRELPVHGPVFSPAKLKRGDRLRVRVVASDGALESAPAETGTVVIANSAPEIVSTPPKLDASGVFTYQIAAIDADGDKALRYELVKGPQGMQVDELSGVLSWEPTPDQAGNHRVEIAVEDRSGGRSHQVFDVPLVAVYESEPPPASR